MLAARTQKPMVVRGEFCAACSWPAGVLHSAFADLDLLSNAGAVKCQASKQTVQKAAAAVTSLPALLAANPAFALVSVGDCSWIACHIPVAPGPSSGDTLTVCCCGVVEPTHGNSKAVNCFVWGSE
jgi:hypothetical protein